MSKRNEQEIVPAWIVTPPSGATRHVTIGGLYDIALGLGFPASADGILEAAKIVPFLRVQKCCVDYSPMVEEPEDEEEADAIIL